MRQGMGRGNGQGMGRGNGSGRGNGMGMSGGMGRRNRGVYCPWREQNYPGWGMGRGYGGNRFGGAMNPPDETELLRRELAELKARQQELEALLKQRQED